MTKHRSRALPLVALLLGGVLLAAPAQAIYIVTPLHLRASASEAEVGDEIQLAITPSEDWDGRSYARETLTLRYSFDPEEGNRSASENPDEPVSHDASRNETPPEETYVFVDAGQVTLDDASRGALSWTVPAEVDDRNVFLTLVDADGEVVANAHVRVGDAEPMAFLMAEGGSPPGDEVRSGPGDDTSGSGDGAGAGADGASTRDVPLPAALAVAAALGAVALLALRRR